jgi:phosphoenolpyruvate-protein kinase (PTS system EI component)
MVIESLNKADFASDSVRRGQNLSELRIEAGGQSSHTAVLVLACNRPTISRALDKIFKVKPSGRFPVIVSQVREMLLGVDVKM